MKIETPPIDLKKKNPFYLSIFAITAAVVGILIYFNYAAVIDIVDRTYASVISTTFTSRKTIEVYLIYEDKISKKEKRLNNVDEELTILNLLQDLNNDGSIELTTSTNGSPVSITEINGKPSIENGKKWECYSNGRKIDEAINNKIVRGGSRIVLIYQ